MYTSITRKLKNNEASSLQDMNTFEKWAEGKIDTHTALTMFKCNNRISPSYNIDKGLFVKWMKSLGYTRKG